MSERSEQLFFEVFESLPRQGPGSRACTARALALCRDVPPSPRVLDLGCGVGAQTFDLAELTSGFVVAVDRHRPNVERLSATVAARELEHRVLPVLGDMARPGQRPESFDLVWSEGALYNVGLETALEVCRGLLRPGGHIAFTDAVWRVDDPPAAVRAGFDEEYPTMGTVPDALRAIELAGFALAGHFTVPDEAWWGDFYTPMLRRVEELRGELAGDAEALAALDGIAAEPEMHRRHSASYAYEFFVARKPGGSGEGGDERPSSS